MAVSVPKILTLDQLVEELHKAFSVEKTDVEYVKALLAAYKSNPADWKKYVYFDPHRYTRNLVDEGNEKFNLLILCWSEGQGSSIHSHSDAHCFVKVLHGTLQETMYEWPQNSNADQPLEQMAINKFETNGVAYINDDLGLHRMENPSNSEGTVSLHVYVPPFRTCNTFDERTGRKKTATMSFWSVAGIRANAGEALECSQRLCHRWRPLYSYGDLQQLRCM